MEDNTLFSPFHINTLEVPNRIVRSATVDNLGTVGMVSDAQLDLYGKLGRGGIGLIITGGLFPTLDGWAARGQLGAHTDEVVPSLRKLVDEVHAGDALIAAQILHGGFQCSGELSGLQPVGPSPMVNEGTGQQVRELSSDEIYAMVESYIQAARRIKEAGFDAVQLHGAHGWLLSAFFSPVTNRRTDEWGGTPEKRSRFVRRILEGIRREAGPDYPVFIKYGMKDYHPEGKTVEEGIETAKLLVAAGADAIELSEGIESGWGHHIRPDAVHPYYLEECRQARQQLTVPIVLVGGMRDVNDMQSVLDEGIADAVSLCRPFIRTPNLVNDIRTGSCTGSGCNSCNGCLKEMQNGTIRCILP